MFLLNQLIVLSIKCQKIEKIQMSCNNTTVQIDSYSVKSDLKQRKAADPHVGEAATREKEVAFAQEMTKTVNWFLK